MTTKVPVVASDTLLADVQKLLEQRMREFETVNYIYVVGHDKKLL